MNYNDLRVGQIWVPDCKNDYTLEIIGLTKYQAELREVETGETYFFELDGPDGFSDFLEQCFYTLKI